MLDNRKRERLHFVEDLDDLKVKLRFWTESVKNILSLVPRPPHLSPWRKTITEDESSDFARKPADIGNVVRHLETGSKSWWLSCIYSPWWAWLRMRSRCGCGVAEGNSVRKFWYVSFKRAETSNDSLVHRKAFN
jgi:hypothetical protein